MTEDGVGDIAGLVGGGIAMFVMLVAMIFVFLRDASPFSLDGIDGGYVEACSCCCIICMCIGMAGTIIPLESCIIIAGYMGIDCIPFGV